MQVLLAITLLTLGSGADEAAFGGEGAFDRELDAHDAVDREKSAMRRRLAEDRVRTDFLRREEVSLLATINTLDHRLAQQRKKGLQLVAERGRLEREVAKVEVKLEEAKQRLGALRDQIGRRAAAMVRLRRTAFSELVAHAATPVEARRLRDRVRIALAHDARLIAQTRDASSEARQLFSGLSARREDLEAATASLAGEAEQTLSIREERAALLSAIQNERSLIERVAGEIARAASRLETELSSLRGDAPPPPPLPGGFAAQRGRLPWPVVGRVEVPFGKRVDPDTGMVMAQKGLDIRAKVTEPVRAVFAGRVAHAGWLEGFGRVVVLEHVPSWYTIYAHLERFAARTGQALDQGQVLGFVGDSGSVKGSYLYFELREGRKAVDPLDWLAR